MKDNEEITHAWPRGVWLFALTELWGAGEKRYRL